MPEPVHPDTQQAPHGGPGKQPFAGLDFSVNTNPYGPDPALLSAVMRADHAHYPDPDYTAVKERLGRWHGVQPGCVVPAVGASELLHRVVRAYLRPGGRVLSVLAPFGEFGRAVALAGGKLDVAHPDQAAEKVRPGMNLVYLGHPHNPTGRFFQSGELEALRLACEKADALLILDLAYATFLNLPCPPPSEHLVLLHSPGKAHGLVGARPAYTLASPAVAAALHNLAPAWALPAGTAALLEELPEAREFVRETLPNVARNAADLAGELARRFEVEHHGTPYMTVRVGNAAGVAAALLAQGLKVRDCASYGQPDWIRVSARLPHENARLIRAMEELHV
ncbi:pyridoxal phosphate-dependent aminotransferase [Deinococcus altitudinis]|uniref:pyridoxal phosphate-dependent aminotransferase n=1 Tax=Deinococcus altitudinis TaxID=468914 RepID=UPI00389174F3